MSLSQQRRQPSPTREALQLHVWFHSEEQHGAVGAAGGDTWGNKAHHIRKTQRGGAGGARRLISSLKQVLESSKRWWKCRNYFNQVGFVPFNILQPMTHVESPVSSRPPGVRAPHITPAVPRPEHTSEWPHVFSLLRPPAGASPGPAAPPKDLLHSPTQPAGSAPLTLPAATAQLTALQPEHTSCRWHGK